MAHHPTDTWRCIRNFYGWSINSRGTIKHHDATFYGQKIIHIDGVAVSVETIVAELFPEEKSE